MFDNYISCTFFCNILLLISRITEISCAPKDFQVRLIVILIAFCPNKNITITWNREKLCMIFISSTSTRFSRLPKKEKLVRLLSFSPKILFDRVRLFSHRACVCAGVFWYADVCLCVLVHLGAVMCVYFGVCLSFSVPLCLCLSLCLCMCP